MTYGAFGRARGRSSWARSAAIIRATGTTKAANLGDGTSRRPSSCHRWASSRLVPGRSTPKVERASAPRLPRRALPDRCPRSPLDCEANGTASHHIQLLNSGLFIRAKEFYIFTFRPRSTKAFTLNQVVLMKQSAPWTPYAEPTDLAVKVGRLG